MSDHGSTQLARKWCPASHGKAWENDQKCCCEDIASAIREALEEAEQVAKAIGAEWDEAYCEGADTYDPVAAANVATGETSRSIAAALAALREPT